MAGVRIFVVMVFLRWIQLTSGSCQPGRFGDSCSYSCHCGTSCDEMTGVCSGSCDPGWRKDGVICQKQNIALNKTASTTSGVHGEWHAANAVDGDSDIRGESRTCFHAGGSPSDLTVDLGRDFQLYDIRIYSRNTFYWRNANSIIYLNNDTSIICSTLPSSPDTPYRTDVTCNGTGRYVTIRKPGAGGHDVFNSSLNICEVEIYVCSQGIYGVDCDKFCHCLDSTCDRLTGLCPGDCRPGWQGQRCDTERVATLTPSHQPEVESFPIAAVVGAVVGVVVILLLVLAVILIRRRRGESHGRSAHKPVVADNVKPTHAEDIGMYINVGFDNAEKPTLSPESTSTTQIKVRKQNKSQGDPAQEAVSTTGSKDTGKGGTGDLDLQKVEEEEDYDVSDQPAQVEDTPKAPDRNYYNLDDNGRNHVIPVSELQTRVEEMSPASADEEFKRLPDGFVHSYDESQQPKNKGKNRFRGYYPYDYNRVALHGVSEDKDKDYINASYLDGYNAEKRYIAAQGPYRPEVVVDFWRMIYQEQSTTIVMVTGLVEAGKMKCLQYWPEKGTSIYGDISVTMETETQLANYTVTKLCVHDKSEGKIHHVQHFHFTSWPDHGVPDTSALLEFMWRVKATTRHQPQPIIVHCSAGIGRTGTYIAIESLVDQAGAEGFVDVVSFVSSMRGQRKNMIQTKEQYLFLNQAVAMAVSEGDTSLDADAIKQIDLSQVSEVTMSNRNVQEHLEALENTPERGLPEDHIITVASYTSRKGFFITTSQPDKEELWNQMYNSDSRTLITLAAENQIFLPSMDSPVSTSSLTASLQTSKVISNDVILNTIDLTVNGADVTSAIQHYHVTGSTHDSSVTLLIDSLLTWMSDPERGSCTIVSHSLSEARFLVLLVNIASRLQDDSRVDVISNMRRLHSTLGGPPFSQLHGGGL